MAFGKGFPRSAEKIPLRIASAIGLCMLACGCAPIYPVQIAPLGNDTYVASQASLSSWLDARTVALQRADAWCRKRGGTFAVVDSEQHTLAGQVQSNDHASVTFTCPPATPK